MEQRNLGEYRQGIQRGASLEEAHWSQKHHRTHIYHGRGARIPSGSLKGPRQTVICEEWAEDIGLRQEFAG